jgi:Protein of unknown function (DUF2992).
MAAVFTVYFEAPFWVGILESEENDRLVVARHVFGAEPTNPELLDFMLYRFAFLPRAATALASSGEASAGTVSGLCATSPTKPRNPKRALREASKERARPPSTKAQAALAAARDEAALERHALSRDEREAAAERRYQQRKEKRKRKKAGH